MSGPVERDGVKAFNVTNEVAKQFAITAIENSPSLSQPEKEARTNDVKQSRTIEGRVHSVVRGKELSVITFQDSKDPTVGEFFYFPPNSPEHFEEALRAQNHQLTVIVVCPNKDEDGLGGPINKIGGGEIISLTVLCND